MQVITAIDFDLPIVLIMLLVSGSRLNLRHVDVVFNICMLTSFETSLLVLHQDQG